MASDYHWPTHRCIYCRGGDGDLVRESICETRGRVLFCIFVLFVLFLHHVGERKDTDPLSGCCVVLLYRLYLGWKRESFL